MKAHFVANISNESLRILSADGRDHFHLTEENSHDLLSSILLIRLDVNILHVNFSGIVSLMANSKSDSKLITEH